MRRTCIAALVLALLTVSCSRSQSGGSTLTGEIVGDGSSTVFPISEAIGEEFKIANPGVEVVVGTSGTGGGFKKFCNGEIDFSDASRKIKDSEKQACAAKSVEWIELQVANDGLAVVVNRANTWVDCLTTGELKKIWEPRSRVKTWRDVRASFPAVAIKLFGPGTDSGTFDYFTAEINGEEGASRTDYTASEDDNTLVTGVAGGKGALGYFGYAYFSENKSKLKLVGVDAGKGCVFPSDETVKTNAYAPLSRPLFVYVKKAAVTRPEVKAFVDFYLDTVNDIIGDVGYTPLADSVLAQEKAEFDATAGA